MTVLVRVDTPWQDYAAVVEAARLLGDVTPVLHTLWDCSAELVCAISDERDTAAAHRVALAALAQARTYTPACVARAGTAALVIEQAAAAGDCSALLCEAGYLWREVEESAKAAGDLDTLARLALAVLAEVSTYAPAQSVPVAGDLEF
ncbi:hypothetical protein [Microbispora sp. CA-102843]|uniref:hypothetical protein n=1 Tax=Microbispora sp. CA-102843 TaxID=3239952 RepID=UPI003D8C7745